MFYDLDLLIYENKKKQKKKMEKQENGIFTEFFLWTPKWGSKFDHICFVLPEKCNGIGNFEF